MFVYYLQNEDWTKRNLRPIASCANDDGRVGISNDLHDRPKYSKKKNQTVKKAMTFHFYLKYNLVNILKEITYFEQVMSNVNRRINKRFGSNGGEDRWSRFHNLHGITFTWLQKFYDMSERIKLLMLRSHKHLLATR